MQLPLCTLALHLMEAHYMAGDLIVTGEPLPADCIACSTGRRPTA